MMIDNPYKKYQTTQIMTADPKKLLIMLLEGANRFLKEAKAAMEEKKFEQAHKSCIKVEKIIMELINSLDLSYGDFTKSLLSLYEYMYRRLIESNLKKDVSIIDEVQVLLTDMENMWKEVYEKILKEEKDKFSKNSGISEKKILKDKHGIYEAF